MAHDGEMSDGERDAWERLDAAAAVPATRALGDTAPGLRPGRNPLRLRRSRSPVLSALDGGGAIFQRRMRDVLVGSAAILAPAVAINLWMTVVAFDRFDPNDTLFPSVVGDDTGTGVEDVSVFFAAVFASFVTAIVGHFVAQLLIGERFRNPVTIGRALLNTLRRVPALSLAWIVGHFWVPLFALIAVSVQDEDASGVIMLFLIVALFASTATLLVVPAMVGEAIGPIAALSRGWRLVRLRYGACMLFVLLASSLASLFLLGVATLVPLLEVTGFATFGGAAWIVQGILVQLGVLIIVPLVALGTAQLYVEVRLDGEGLDLVIDADAAFGHAPPVAAR